MNDHDQYTCAIPGCQQCGIVRASQALPEHRAMLAQAMEDRPQVLSKARALGMTSCMLSDAEGYMCYRSHERPEHHFAIVSYDMAVDAADKPLHVVLTVAHGRDSTSPGIMRMGTPLDSIYPCGCGRWQMPTDEQVDAMKRKVAGMGARDFARRQREALRKKRPS
jgi:hypothetical protein